MPFCQTCKGHYFASDHHRCPPRWRCWDITNDCDEADASVIYAFDGEAAAEKYVEGLDEVSDGDEHVIGVRPEEGGKLECWKVTTELTMTYHAEAVEEEEPQAAEPVAEAPESAGTCWLCEGTERFEGHVCDGCGSVADGAGGTEPVREAVEPLVGMPRFRSRLTGRIEVDGTKPGGVIARFLVLGNWHELAMHADRYDAQPCATLDDLERMVLDDLERMVLDDLEDIESVRPIGALHLRPLEEADVKPDLAP